MAARIFTTDLTHWREELCRLFLGLDFEPTGEEHFRGSIEPILISQGIRLGRFSHSAGSLTRSKRLIQDGNDDLVMLLPTKATMMMDTVGCNSPIEIGQAALIRNGNVARATNNKENSVYALMVDPRLANQPDSDLLKSSGRVLRRNKNLKLMATYVAWMHRHNTSITAETSHVLSRQLIELATVCSSAQSDGEDDSSARAVRLRLAKDYLSQNFQDSGISEMSLAAAQGISVRYLQRLFEKEGTMFSACLAEYRLQAAYQLLRSPKGGRSIQDVALDVGYNDLSNFHRKFKRKFGLTPADIRKQWLKEIL